MGDRAIVVGGGAIGIAAAYYLSRSGWRVTLLERDQIGHGCSYGNCCLIVPSHSEPLPKPGLSREALRWMLSAEGPIHLRPRVDRRFLRWAWRFRRSCNAEVAQHGFEALLSLSRASLDLFDELRDNGVDFLYRREGLLQIYLSQRSFAGAIDESEKLAAAGFTPRLLDVEEAVELEPALSPRIAGALFIESDAHGDCFEFVQSMASALERNGVKLVTGHGVSGLTTTAGRIDGVVVDTLAERLPADIVVLAAGSWTAQLARSIGVDVPLEPAKGYSCTIERFPGAPRIPLLVKDRHVIITPLGDRLRFGGILELVGYDEGVDNSRYRWMIRAGARALKSSFETRNEKPWCGFRPLTPDGLPIIDRAPGVSGVIVATGHAMLGFTQSPITGKLVAELANGDSHSVPLSPFRIERF